MRDRLRLVVVAALGVGGALRTASGGDPSPLSAEDRAAFAWFDSIGLPSCAGKAYVRVRWTQGEGAPDLADAPPPWEVDGFVVHEKDGVMTLLDADFWGRKVTRAPAPGWSGGVSPLPLDQVVRAATGRLRAIVTDPGAVEPMDELFRGIRLRCGDEAQALALARHAAANGLELEAHALLEAARALPPRDAASAGAALEAVAATQMAESVLWRILFDFADAGSSRAALAARLRGWLKAFPKSPHVPRAADGHRIVSAMAEEDARHVPVPPVELSRLSPDRRARELVFRLREQTGDVYMGRDGRVSIDLGDADSPAGRLEAMGLPAVPALLEALTDARYTRAVLFIRDMEFKRQVVARVGDLARVILERIAGQEFWKVPENEPSMFQHGAAAEVAVRARAWHAPAEDFAVRLRAIAAEPDPKRRASLAAELPDRGTGPIPGATDAIWGTRSVLAALPGLDEAAAKELLRVLVAHGSRPRSRTLAAWALLDLGEGSVVADVVALWSGLSDEVRGDPEQGGVVISFLAACGSPAGVAALSADLALRPPVVRELVVLAFGSDGLGAVRGFAADPPEGIRSSWPGDPAHALAVEDLLAARLEDLEVDPLGRIARQVPLCDIDPTYDAGRRIADAALRVMTARWPSVYPTVSAPARRNDEWESLRTTFLSTWRASRAKGDVK